MNRRSRNVCLLLVLAVLILFPAGLFIGGVAISPSQVCEAIFGNADTATSFIVLESRLPALVTAMLTGAALSVAGLLMQTSFNNPLAGPTIMGISAGSSLGVALVIMLFGGAVGWLGNMAIVAGAFIGALAVLLVLILFSGFVKSSYSLLIVGILVGYLTSSIISLLNYFSADSAVHAFVVWGLGTFSGVSLDVLPVFAVLVIVCLGACLLYHRSLDALTFGVNFATLAGMNVKRVRTGLILLSGALTALATAWCGPIGFIGLVVPHIARILTGSGVHSSLLPATALSGAVIGLLCQILSIAPSLVYGSTIPVNAITPVFGVPLILYVLLRRMKNFSYAD